MERNEGKPGLGVLDDPRARFSIDGPFRDGAWIATELPGQTLVSAIRDVEAGRAARIELELSNAVFRFHWRFDDLNDSEGRADADQ